MKFSTIVADPPWYENGGGRRGVPGGRRGAQRHYPLLTTRAICQLPVAHVCEDAAHLYLWVTNNFLPDGLKVMEAWGFRYVTNLAWGKYDTTTGAAHRGIGQYFRGGHELCLFGSRGVIPYRRQPNGKPIAQPSTLMLSPVGKHSQKPDALRQTVETVSPGPYLELFARPNLLARDGWTPLGNEITGRCLSEDLQALAATVDSV